MKKLYVVGLGPGDEQNMTGRALTALEESEVIVGYTAYVDLIRARYPEKVKVLPVEKDDTDMLAAIKEGLNKGFEEFVIYGGQGGRLAHTMANIQCLNYLKEKGAKGYLMDGNGMILVAKNETVRFKKNLEGFLSLFSLGEKAEGVTITNMKYLLDKAVVTNDFPIGVSNEFIGKESSVTVENGTLLIMIDWN